MTPPKLLVTGFSSFPGARRNPTEALVAGLDVVRLAERLGVELAVTVLPTEYVAVADLLPRLWEELRPDAVIHFGLHGRAATIRIEMRANNHMSPVRPDAARQRPVHPAIARDGPPVRRATLPVWPMVAALHRRGIAARLSPDAGSYLCNYASYLSLGLAPKGALAGFVHLPWPAEITARHAPSRRPAWAALAVAVEEMIRAVAISARQRQTS
jgi:pyroglutamyl-peptidase